jgi:hypothetical protein
MQRPGRRLRLLPPVRPWILPFEHSVASLAAALDSHCTDFFPLALNTRLDQFFELIWSDPV